MASTPTVNIPSVNSSIDSLKMAEGSPGGFAGTGGAKNVNFLSQLEHMMVAVKKEANSLESMKLKIKDMEELKNKLTDAKSRLTAAESENQQLRRLVKDSDDQNIAIRNDMQRLNDIYHAERTKLTEAQQVITRLEQEISGIKREKEFFSGEAAKVPELKSALKTAKTQLSATAKNSSEEKLQLETKCAEVTKKCSLLEKANEDSSRHLSNMQSDLNASKTRIQELELEVLTETEKVNRERALRAVAQDRYLMSTEDLRLQVQRLPVSVLKHEERIDGLKNELQKLKSLATIKTNELHLSLAEAKKLQEKLELGSQAYTTQITTLQTSLQDTTNKLNELHRSNTSLKQKYATKVNELDIANKESAEVKTLYKQLQQTAQQREQEAAQAIKGLNLQSEDYGFKLQSVTAQLEALQQQTKGEQGKHWEELKKLKDSESFLLEEVDRLTQDLNEKTIDLHTVTSNATNMETALRNENNTASTMVTTLKDELEKRLKDIMNLREERDTLQGDKEDLTAAIESLKADIGKNDGVFKRTLEQDRNKMKQELLARTQRIRALEAEKQELLSETEQLVSQVTDTRNEINSLQSKFNDLVSTKDRLSEQYDVIKSHNTQLTSDLHDGDRAQEELKMTIERNNAMHSENTERLEMLLREAKKSASQQVLEMSQHIKAMTADYDQLQLEHEKAQDAEKRAILDLERAKNEINTLTLTHNETTHNLNNDNNNLRRELQEIRTKGKILLESKTRVEMELINMRNENGKYEMDAHKLNVIIKEHESTVNSLQDNIAQLTSQLSGANESVNRYKGIVGELEEGVQRKNATIEGLKEDLVQLERDGLVEIRRLRVQLNSAENEISELRPMIPLLQKEASEAKNTLSSMKNNQSGTVNNLLEEVRRGEEALARERKKAGAEIDSCHSRISELQVQLEKTRDILEETAIKAKTDRSERDLRLMQLEGEAERAKSATASKEGRIEELVQQHHADRVKLHEMSEKVSTSETEMASLRSSLSHEQAARQRLEARLRSLMSTPDYAAESIGGGFLSARGHSSSGNRTKNSFANNANNNVNNVTNSMYRATSSDAWEEEVFNNNTAGSDDYSVANTLHSSATVHSNNTGNTAHYNTNPNNHNNNLYNGGHTVRAQSPFHPTRYAQNDNFTTSNSNSNNNNNSSRHDLSLQNISDRHYSDSSNSKSPPPSLLMSPTREPTGTRHAQSPVVDRVSAALAAKATLETSKNALKFAQQSRHSRHAVGGSSGNGREDGYNSGDREGLSNSSSTGVLPLNLPNTMLNSHSSSNIHPENRNARRPPSGNKNSDSDDWDYATAIYNTTVDNTQNTHGSSSLYGSNSSTSNSNSNTNNNETSGSGAGNSVEDTIRRTQMMLSKRGVGAPPAATATTTAASTGTMNSDGTTRTPTSGRGASKLSESIQQASALYPPSPSKDPRNRLAAVSDEDNYNESGYIDTPALRPISPPRHQSSTNPNNNTTSSALYNVPTEENEDSDESDTDMHTNSVAPYGGSGYNGHGSSNPNIHYVSAGGAGGAGGGGSGGKKGKKGKKSTTSSGSSGKYNGLEEALQLPKIGATGSAVRRK